MRRLGQPTLSVITICYNHEKYIGQALESILAQKTNFTFTVIVADDGSTDSTQAIIRSYAQKFPQIIRPILRRKNIGATPNFFDALKKARGKYIALCEGDDFWTDPAKLQTQVDYLEKHPKVAFCFHPVKVFFEDNREPAKNVPPLKSKASQWTLERLVEGNFIHTCSVVFRRRDYRDLNPEAIPTDWHLHLYNAQFGTIGWINKSMAAYRRHPEGLWWDGHVNPTNFWKKFGIHELTVYAEAERMHGDKPGVRERLTRGVASRLSSILRADQTTFLTAAKKFPGFVVRYANFLLEQYQGSNTELDELRQKLQATREELEKVKAELGQTGKELKLIRTSRSWRYLTKLRRLLKGN